MVKHIIIILSTLFMATFANKTSIIPIQKCCLKDEKLIYTMEGLNCVKEYKNINLNDSLWWIPKELIINDMRTLLKNNANIVFGSKPDCELYSMDVLFYKNIIDDPMIDFSFRVRDGQVLVDVLKESSFHNPDKGRDESFPPEVYCVDGGPGASHLAILCPCSKMNCVRTCCMDGFAYNETSNQCVDSEFIDDWVDWTPKLNGQFDYYRLASKSLKCDQRSTHVMPTRSNQSQMLLYSNASLQVLDQGTTTYPANKFCGTFNIRNEEMLIFCMKSTKPQWTFIVYGVLFLVGAAALLATVVVTAILPEMRRNIHGRMALAHNVMLFIGYTAIGVSQLQGATVSIKGCATISLIIQFSILSAFFWLNVMCVDISWTFSGLRPIRGSAMQRDRKKFIYYSLYAWGGTALISTATMIVEFTPSVTRLKPKFGEVQCFFNDRLALLVFFYGPMALLLLGNLLLFVFTAFKIFAVKRDTAILTAKDSSMNAKNKQKLILYVKLFCLMGVTYVSEVVGFAVGATSYWWYLTDTINILRAVFIFVIFCCKRTVYRTIRDKVLQLFGVQVPNRNASTGMRSFQSHTSCTGTSASVSPNACRKLFSSESTKDLYNTSLKTKTSLNMNPVHDLKV